MREIKFRAFDELEHKWKYFHIPQLDKDDFVSLEGRNFDNYGQFTGLKDKNGKRL